MDTILLVIGVVGLSISGWVLRGYFIRTPPVLTSEKPSETESDEADSTVVEPTSYVTSEEHQLLLVRIAELEKGGYSPKVEENGSLTPAPVQELTPPSGLPSAASVGQGPMVDESINSETWNELFALQQAYKLEREKEKDIDYEREQVLFDISQDYDGKHLGQSVLADLSEEDQLDQRLLDNQLEAGEELNEYQERITTFASLTKEMLIMRLDAADKQLREQQEKHQATLLNIISTLIERMPGDVNLKSVIQSSYVAASAETSNEEGEYNRNLFQEMFLQHVGR